MAAARRCAARRRASSSEIRLQDSPGLWLAQAVSSAHMDHGQQELQPVDGKQQLGETAASAWGWSRGPSYYRELVAPETETFLDWILASLELIVQNTFSSIALASY